MKEVAKLITKSGEPTFVVLSAMSGTTNSLVEISNYLYKKNRMVPTKSSTDWRRNTSSTLRNCIATMSTRHARKTSF